MKEVFMIKESTYDPLYDKYHVKVKSIWATMETAEREVERLPKQKPEDPDIVIEHWIEKWQIQS